MSKKPESQKPEKADPDRIIVPMQHELVARIDDFRFETRSPSRAEAIRDLIEFALANKPRGAK